MKRGQIEGASTECMLAGKLFDVNTFKNTAHLNCSDDPHFGIFISAEWLFPRIGECGCAEFPIVLVCKFQILCKYRSIPVPSGLTYVFSISSNRFLDRDDFYFGVVILKSELYLCLLLCPAHGIFNTDSVVWLVFQISTKVIAGAVLPKL